MLQWDRDYLWDLTWLDAGGTPLQEKRGLPREVAELQAQAWSTQHPGSRVYLYRRRGDTSVLVQVWNEG